MSFIEWENVSKVNITSVDEQHHKLVSLINELFEAMSSGKGIDVVGNVLNQLISYTKYHFSLEESYMRNHNYPDYEIHKKMHDELTKEVVTLNEKFQSGHTSISVPTLNFLTNWLTNHISQIDTKFGDFLIKKGINL